MIAFPSLNLLAVVVAAIVSFVIGGIYYAPPLFGKTYLKLIGKKQEEVMKPSNYAALFILTIIVSFVMAIFVGYAGAKTALDGAIIGFWVWLGFVITTVVGDDLLESKPIKLTLLSGAFFLVNSLVMGAILGAWPP